MIKLEAIGNLGANAELKDHNGRKFISFRIAHSDSYANKDTGEIVKRTTWISCIINGDGGALTPYLKKGTKVFVRGNLSINIFNSAMSHQQEVGLNLAVWEIELCGGQREDNNSPEQSQNVEQKSTSNKQQTNKKKEK